MKARDFSLLIAILLITANRLVHAELITAPVPHTFTAGDKVVAEEMNQNFNHVIDSINGITLTPGPQGIHGETGAQGPAGLTGAQGLIGVPGLTGAKGDQGTQGLTGPQGPIGIPGLTGAKGDQGAQGSAGIGGINGIPGANGQSVTTSTLNVGDSHCAQGGVALLSASGTDYICHGLSDANAGLTNSNYYFFIDIPGIGNAYYQQVNLSTESEILENIVDFQTLTTILVPGRFSTLTTVLKQDLDNQQVMASWRTQLLTSGHTPVDVNIILYDKTGENIASWTLYAAWPSLSKLSSVQGAYIVESNITNLNIVREANAQGPNLSAANTIELRRNGSTLGRFSEFSDLGNETRIIETTDLDGSMMKVPGRDFHYKTTLLREIEKNTDVDAWRTEVAAGQVATARCNVSLIIHDTSGVPILQWELIDAWPSKIQVFTADDGRVMEAITLVYQDLITTRI